MANYVFGIDFGTSHIGGACAQVDENGKPSKFVVFTSDESLTYICPAGDLASSEIQEFLPHSKGCRTTYNAGDEIGCEFIIGSDARDKYQFFLNDNEGHSLQNYNKFESYTVPASTKTILVNHLNIDRIYNGEKPYEEFYNQNEYEIEPSEFFTTMFFREFFLRAKNLPGVRACYTDVEQVDFVIGTPPGCGEKYAVELIKCVKNGFYLAIKAGDAKRAKALRMRGRTSPEPLLAGYAWFGAVENVKGALDEGETAFIVDIGAGTTDWTFVTRYQNKILPLTQDDNGKPIESMGTNFGTSGNAFDKAIKTDLDVFFKLRGVENGIILEQMARGIKEKLYDPGYPEHYFPAQIDKADPSKPIVITANGKSRNLTSFTFNVFKRPELKIVGEDGEDRYITFDEYRDLENLAKKDARFKGFLASGSSMLASPDYYYEPSSNPELDLFFVDLISDESDPLNNLEKKFDNIAKKTLNYFNQYKFKTTPKILFVGNSSNLTALKEHITDKLEFGLETEFIHPDILELGAKINSMLQLKGRYKINFSNAIAIGACLSIGKSTAEVAVKPTVAPTKAPTGVVSGDTFEAIRSAFDELGVLSERYITTHLGGSSRLINKFGGINCTGSAVELVESSQNALISQIEGAIRAVFAGTKTEVDLSAVTAKLQDIEAQISAIGLSTSKAFEGFTGTIASLEKKIDKLSSELSKLTSGNSSPASLSESDLVSISSTATEAVTPLVKSQADRIIRNLGDKISNIASTQPSQTPPVVFGFGGLTQSCWALSIMAFIMLVFSALVNIETSQLWLGVIAMAFPVINGIVSSSRMGKKGRVFFHVLMLLASIVFAIIAFSSVLTIMSI